MHANKFLSDPITSCQDANHGNRWLIASYQTWYRASNPHRILILSPQRTREILIPPSESRSIPQVTWKFNVCPPGLMQRSFRFFRRYQIMKAVPLDRVDVKVEFIKNWARGELDFLNSQGLVYAQSIPFHGEKSLKGGQVWSCQLGSLVCPAFCYLKLPPLSFPFILSLFWKFCNRPQEIIVRIDAR